MYKKLLAESWNEFRQCDCVSIKWVRIQTCIGCMLCILYDLLGSTDLIPIASEFTKWCRRGIELKTNGWAIWSSDPRRVSPLIGVYMYRLGLAPGAGVMEIILTHHYTVHTWQADHAWVLSSLCVCIDNILSMGAPNFHEKFADFWLQNARFWDNQLSDQQETSSIDIVQYHRSVADFFASVGSVVSSH